MSQLYDFIYPDGKYSNIRANSRTICKNFPEIYESIKNDYHVKLYMLLHDISSIPICKNPRCNNEVKLKNISEGFRTCCCNKCIGEYQKTDKNFAIKIGNTKLAKNILPNKYGFPIIVDPSNKYSYIIPNYCKHGDLNINKQLFDKILLNDRCACQKCNSEIVESYYPSEEEINIFKNNFIDFYKENSLSIKESWLLLYHPKLYKTILIWSEHLKDITFSERIYLFKNSLKERPLCSNCKKHKTTWNHSQLSYTIMCESPACRNNTSLGEIELYNYVNSIIKTAKQKFYINRHEYDIIIPEKHILIEYNGLYWHGEDVKKDNNNYHLNKLNLANENGFKLISIWEDDWHYKTDIIKSIIKNKLGKTEIKIGARKCDIRIVSAKDSKLFLFKNHLQGNCVDSVRIGLYYKNELVSLMTFGNRKISGTNRNELLRFCNLINYSVIGGASKLFKYYVDNYKPEYVKTYASLDHSGGDLYKYLGFKLIGKTGPSFYWCKNKIKYNRNNFTKWKLLKNGSDPNLTADEIMRADKYYKIWSSGSLSFEWNVKNKMI